MIVEIDNEDKYTLQIFKTGVTSKAKQALSNLKRFRKTKAKFSDDQGETPASRWTRISDLDEPEDRPRKLTRRLLEIKCVIVEL